MKGRKNLLQKVAQSQVWNKVYENQNLKIKKMQMQKNLGMLSLMADATFLKKRNDVEYQTKVLKIEKEVPNEKARVKI